MFAAGQQRLACSSTSRRLAHGVGVCRRDVGGLAALCSSSSSSRGMAATSTTCASSSNGGAAFAGSSPAELEAWLELHGVSTAPYGRGAARTTLELFEEVSNAESVLTVHGTGNGSRALRLVSVLNLYIKNECGQVLIEAGQRLPDGRLRQRCLPLSEKMIGHEGWQAAAVRAVAEELATALPHDWRSQLVIDEGSYHQLVETQESTSYPGLLTQYTCHKVHAQLPCLPQQPFTTEEPRPNGVLTNYWEWQPCAPVAAVMRTQDLK